MGGSVFSMGWGEFQRVMDIYMKQIDDKSAGAGSGKGQAEIESIWREMTSQSQGQKQAYINIRDFHQIYDKVMPKICDREVALEVF